jgi:hypothetical protein
MWYGWLGVLEGCAELYTTGDAGNGGGGVERNDAVARLKRNDDDGVWLATLAASGG